MQTRKSRAFSVADDRIIRQTRTTNEVNCSFELFDFKITQLKRCKSKLIFVMGSVSNIQ